MINIIADVMAGLYSDSYKNKKKAEFLTKMRNHENLKKLNENKKEELLDECLGLINIFEDDYYEYRDDPYIEILVDPDGERYDTFVGDNDWRHREYLKMCLGQYLYSFSISEIYELD